MAIKDIIAKGVGFSPGDTHFIPTHGFDSDLTPPPVGGDSPIAIYSYAVGACCFIFAVIWRLP